MFVRNAAQRYRVFVFGLEVTDDVLSVSYSCNDGRAPSTANIMLSNNGFELLSDAGPEAVPRQIADKYVLTTEDIATLYSRVPPGLLVPPVIDEGGESSVRPGPEVSNAENLSIEGLAERFNVSVEEIQEVNPGRTDFSRFVVPVVRQSINDEDDRRDVARRNARLVDAVVLDTLEDFPDPKRTLIERKFPIQVNIDPVLTRREGVPGTVTDRRVTNQDVTFLDFGFDNSADIMYLYSVAGRAPVYPFTPNTPVFHTSDPVRIFACDPVDSTWYYAFTGKLASWTVDVDSNEQSTISLTAEDVRRDAKISRISLSPAPLDQGLGAVESDLILRSWTSVALRELPLEEKIYTLLFGKELECLQFPSGDSYSRIARHAYGFESAVYNRPTESIASLDGPRSATFLFGPPDSLASVRNEYVQSKRVSIDGPKAFQTYLNFTDTRVRTSDVRISDQEVDAPVGNVNPTLAGGRRVFEVEEVLITDTREPDTVEEAITVIGQDPRTYPVDGGRVFLLLPASLALSGNNDFFIFGINGLETETTFVDRLGVILDVLEPLDFCCFVSGRGDLHIEMPLRDFDPWDMGLEPFSPDESSVMTPIGPNGTSEAAFSSELFQETYDAFRERKQVGGAGVRHRFFSADQNNHSLSFVDDRVKTVIRTHYRATPLESQDPKLNTFTSSLIVNPALLVAFGPRAEIITPDYYFGSGERAEQASKYWAGVKLNMFNSEAYQASVRVYPPRPGLVPNRPIEMFDQGYIGTLRNVEYTWKPGQSTADMTMSMNSVRLWRGGRRLVESTGVRFYPGIAGNVGQPINYAERLNISTPSNRFTPTEIATPEERQPEARVEAQTQIQQNLAILNAQRAKIEARLGRLTVTSTLRTAARNRAVGGDPESYHLVGKAMDFTADAYFRRPRALALAVQQLQRDGVIEHGTLIWYNTDRSGFVHYQLDGRLNLFQGKQRTPSGRDGSGKARR